MSETKSAIAGKILVPIDFSPSSHVALETASELAAKFGSELVLLHVVAGLSADALAQAGAEEAIVAAGKADAEKQLAAPKTALDAKGIKTSVLIAVDNDVAGYILEAAEREKVDLVVISTHGVSGWYPSVFGSVTQKIVKLIHSPLLLLRTEKPESSVKKVGGRLMEWW